jgi:hypothetical protein
MKLDQVFRGEVAAIEVIEQRGVHVCHGVE